MSDLLRMDCFCLRRKRSVMVCLILAFVFALVETPLAALFRWLLHVDELIPPTPLSEILKSPYSSISRMLLFLGVSGFYFADQEGGFIKTIAGQFPRRSYIAVSKFFVTALPVAVFALAGILGDLIGRSVFYGVVFDAEIPAALGKLLLKLLLAHAVCTILLMVVSALRLKALGITLSVLFGLGFSGMIYDLISLVFYQLFKKHFELGDYMPDQILAADDPKTVLALVSAGVTIALFLYLSVWLYNRRDVR